ncbi:MAG TPA: enoyl-CoA hydratase-related protein [Vicinamibacterales bacterium]|nr:enoyl-CoA hydratase-related protein [Vicinamibacterales bacterium]
MSHIRIDRDGAVGVITLDRVARFNSLDVETARDLRRAGLQMARDEEVRAVVLRGAGGIFCSGADLKYIAAGGSDADLAYLTPASREVPAGYGERFKQILEYLHSTISEIRRAPKPFIAAVDGMAAAGGFGLAMSCDLVFASPRATFEWAYGKTALSGAESSTFLLPRLIGLRRSMTLMLLNPRLSAEQAVEMGLATAVVHADAFDVDVLATAHTLAAGPTRAFATAKALLNQAAGIDRLDFHLDQELEHLVRSANSDEFREGLLAFFEKRPPVFAPPAALPHA